MQNKLWLGYGFAHGNAYFSLPYGAYKDFADGVYDEATGLVKFRNVTWYTNIETPKRYWELDLWKEYSPDEYPRYDNYDAIEVSKTDHIPVDYFGVMGVPITFLDKYCPNQFEIIGCSDNGAVPDEYKLPHFKAHNEPFIDGKKLYKRLFIRRRRDD